MTLFASILDWNEQESKASADNIRASALAQKKGGTNGLAVRAGRPVTQTTSSFGESYLSRLLNGNIYTLA
jgi:hypothetical protein